MKKQCKGCKEIKNLDEFPKDKRKLDGLQGKCKVCVAEYDHKYYLEHKNKKSKYNKKYRLDHLEKRREDNYKYGLEHKEEKREYDKKYMKTDAGKESNKRKGAKRKDFGFIPINNQFEGCNGHHIDKILVIYIPVKLHKSIHHSVIKDRNMKEINYVAFEWLAMQEIL